MEKPSGVSEGDLQAFQEVIETFSVFCGVVALSFAKYGQDLRETIIRNFIARGMSCTKSIFAVWKAGSEADAWILHRTLLDRLFHLHQLAKTDSFSEFDEFSFRAMYEARLNLLSDPLMKAKAPADLKELQKVTKSRYDSIVAGRPKWQRPKAEDVAKEMDMGFLYRFGYHYASMYVHPMATDGQDDYARLVAPPRSLALPDPTVIANTILVQSMLVQEGLNVSRLRWRAIVYDFLDQIRTFPESGDRKFQLTMYEIGSAWPDFELCEPSPPRDVSENPSSRREP